MKLSFIANYQQYLQQNCVVSSLWNRDRRKFIIEDGSLIVELQGGGRVTKFGWKSMDPGPD